jgi:hypothetical protein
MDAFPDVVATWCGGSSERPSFNKTLRPNMVMSYLQELHTCAILMVNGHAWTEAIASIGFQPVSTVFLCWYERKQTPMERETRTRDG